MTFTLECPECGRVKESKDYQKCSYHKSTGMYKVERWGKDSHREPSKRGPKKALQTKGLLDEKTDKSE